MLWYSPFGISSMRRRSVSPPSSANAARRRGPYFSVTTCQPWSANTDASSDERMPGTTRSRLCRLKSMIHVTRPSPRVAMSEMASHTLPSSSSASPISATKRRRLPRPKCASR